MGPDRAGRRRRPVRATPRSPRPARTAIVATVVVIAGAVAGVGVANGDVTDAVAGALGMRQSAPAGSTADGEGPRDSADGADNAAAPSAIGPITAPRAAPAGEPGGPTPKVSVAPRIDMDLHSLDDPASPWVVVNKARPLDPETWVPPELDSAGGAAMVPEAAHALADMRAAAADAGSPLSVGSGYRAYGIQQSIFADYAERWGRDRADRFSARAGHSEHQTGWAVDVYGSVACRLKECFANEPAGRWVAENGHEYGFVVRYPPGSEEITGYKHEPWHLRYVGVELATEMRERDVATMEEFFSLPAAPEYG